MAKLLIPWLVVCLANASCGTDAGVDASGDDGVALDSQSQSDETQPSGNDGTLVAFVPLGPSSADIVRAQFPSGLVQPVGLPADALPGTRLSWHFSSASSGAMISRAEDGNSWCIYTYVSAGNRWEEAVCRESGEAYFDIVHTLPGDHAIYTRPDGFTEYVGLFSRPGLLEDFNVDWAVFDPASPDRPEFGTSNYGFWDVAGKLQISTQEASYHAVAERMKLVGMQSLGQSGTVSALLGWEELEPTYVLFQATTTTGTQPLAASIEAGQRRLLGSFQQTDDYVLSPEPVYCRAGACEGVLIPPPLSLVHHPGPPVLLVSPGRGGSGSASLVDLRGRPYEWEMVLAAESDGLTVDAWYPDAQGSQWIRLSGYRGTPDSPVEFVANIDTLEPVTEVQDGFYGPSLTYPNKEGGRIAEAGYFFR